MGKQDYEMVQNHERVASLGENSEVSKESQEAEKGGRLPHRLEKERHSHAFVSASVAHELEHLSRYCEQPLHHRDEGCGS